MSKRLAVPIICAVALLLLLGAAAYTLTVAASGVFGRLSARYDDALSLRIAANYLTNHIRRIGQQSDVAKVGDCLVLSEDLEGEVYETRIYLKDGMLRESFVPARADYDDATAFDITPLDGFAITVKDGVVYLALGAGRETRTVAVSPRGTGGKP